MVPPPFDGSTIFISSPISSKHHLLYHPPPCGPQCWEHWTTISPVSSEAYKLDLWTTKAEIVCASEMNVVQLSLVTLVDKEKAQAPEGSKAHLIVVHQPLHLRCWTHGAQSKVYKWASWQPEASPLPRDLDFVLYCVHKANFNFHQVLSDHLWLQDQRTANTLHNCIKGAQCTHYLQFYSALFASIFSTH